MREHLQNIIDYLNGKIDLYNGQYEKSISIWNEVWDEMKWMGYKPDTVHGIKRYIAEQL